MSQLHIEGADYGFDEHGSEEALKRINEEVIERVVDRMEKAVDRLMDAVDNAWVGPSAEIFKDKLFEDFKTIKYGMGIARKQLYTTFSETQQQMYDADLEILSKREGKYNGLE